MAGIKAEGLILYADDSPVEQELLKQALKEKKFSFKVEFFNNGDALLAYVNKLSLDGTVLSRPLIIMLDWEMPQKSGHEILNILKQHDTWKLIPVLIFSSHDDPEIITAAYKAHANAYLQKPRDYDELPRILASIEDFWMKKVLYASDNTDLP